MSRNVPHFSRIPPAPRFRLSSLVHHLGLLAGGIGLSGSLLAGSGDWDCQAGADGSWQCSQNGLPEVRPRVESSPTITPLHEPAPQAVAPTASEPKPPVAAEPPAPAPVAAPPAPPTPERPAPEPLPSAAPPPAPTTTADSPYEVSTTPTAAPDMTTLPVENGTRAATETAGDEQERPAAANEAETLPEPAPAQEAATPTTNNIDRLDDGITWQSCAAAPASALQAAPGNGPLPIDIVSDSAELSERDNQATFNGNVVLTQGTQALYAREVHLDRNSNQLSASGDVLLQRPDLRIAAEQVQYNLHTHAGSAQQAEYRLPGILARGTAEKAELIDPANSSYSQITYTTCPPGNNDWQLSAAGLRLDTAEGLGTATDAKLSFKGVPLMYLPTLTFPIDDRRRSGLLVPSIGYGDKHGMGLSLPYYLNLAPNYDLTLVPRLMSKRGIMLGGEFRFLTPSSQGELNAQYLPHDRRGPAGDERRGSLSLLTHGRYSPNLSSALRINYASDDSFLSDFGSDLEITSASHLERAAELRYQTDRLDLLVRAQQFQTIDSTLPKASHPYTRLPQIAFAFHDRGSAAGRPLSYGIDAELVNFRKTGGFVQGKRLDLQPTLGMPMRDSWYHLIPRASLRYTAYRLDNQAPGLSSSPDRLAPVLSLDGGLYYDRAGSWFGHAITQTLEPRLYYLYIPHKDHSAIPLFDTSEYDFSFDNLFRENRFTGADRLGDANQLTLALTSRINRQDDGSELLRASLGGILYLRDRKVQLSNTAPATTDDTSALASELAATLGGGWQARAGLIWDPNNNTVDQTLAQASYRGPDAQVFNASYRLRDGVSTHTDLGLIWPLGDRSRAIARWNYSLSERRNLDALAGVEYGKCCWKVRALLRQQVQGTNNDQNLSFLLQLELRGLGKLGDNIDAILNDGIYGYRR